MIKIIKKLFPENLRYKISLINQSNFILDEV